MISDKIFPKRSSPGSLPWIHDVNIRLLEALYVLLLEKQERWWNMVEVTEDQIALEKQQWPCFPDNLSEKEIKYPYKAIRKCFRKIGIYASASTSMNGSGLL